MQMKVEIKEVLNSLRPSHTYMHQPLSEPSLVQIMACSLAGAHPLSKPMLPYSQLHTKKQTSVKYKSKLIHFHSRKCIWKCRLENVGHFVSLNVSNITLGPKWHVHVSYTVYWKTVLFQYWWTHYGWNKMATISQTVLINAFSWKKISEFQLKCQWSLFWRIQLTIFQHWFRWWFCAVKVTSHYMNQWWPSLLTNICVTLPQWVKIYLLVARVDHYIWQ